MVENGLVLDDRGAWIPLIDKLRMERFFIDRLAAGEVLRNKHWISISEAAAIDSNAQNQPPQTGTTSDIVPDKQQFQIESNFPQAPNVQVNIAVDTPRTKISDEFSFNDFLNEEEPAVEPEMEETNHSTITPEQCSTMIEQVAKAEAERAIATEVQNDEHTGEIKTELDPPEIVVEKKIEKAPSVDSFFVDYTEHETVVLTSSKMEELIKVDDSLITVTKARATRKIPAVKYNENIEEILESIEEFDEWEKNARKRQALFFALISGLAAILGSSAILLLIFI
ncbi:MAG TPA: hypothetical protein VHO70_22135 [Chitinispirillaceae bacterium]|nr:hypothetical protein [Chitinispirillaceae bacterium]